VILYNWEYIIQKLKLGRLSVTETVILLPSLELLLNTLSLLEEFVDGADINVLSEIEIEVQKSEVLQGEVAVLSECLELL